MRGKECLRKLAGIDDWETAGLLNVLRTAIFTASSPIETPFSKASMISFTECSKTELGKPVVCRFLAA